MITKSMCVFKQNSGILFPASCQSRWLLGTGGNCHAVCTSPPVGAGVWRGDTWLHVGKIHTVCCRPHFSLIYFLLFSFMAFLEMHFPESSFPGHCREISICIIFNSLQRIPPPTHKTMCFYKENINIRANISTYGVRVSLMSKLFDGLRGGMEN